MDKEVNIANDRIFCYLVNDMYLSSDRPEYKPMVMRTASPIADILNIQNFVLCR